MEVCEVTGGYADCVGQSGNVDHAFELHGMLSPSYGCSLLTVWRGMSHCVNCRVREFFIWTGVDICAVAIGLHSSGKTVLNLLRGDGGRPSWLTLVSENR